MKTEIENDVKNEEKTEIEKKADITEIEKIDNEKKPIKKVVEEIKEDIFDINETVEDIIKETPEISEHVFEANKKEFNVTENPSLVNYSESQFDPIIHRSDAEGKPILTKSGDFWKKAGRRKGGKNSSLGSIPEMSPEEHLISEQNKSFAKIGVLTAGQIRNYLGGENSTEDERAYLEGALNIWLDAKQIVVSPDIGLLIAIGTFFIPLVNVPFEQNKIAQIGLLGYQKILGKFAPAQDGSKNYDINGNEEK